MTIMRIKDTSLLFLNRVSLCYVALAWINVDRFSLEFDGILPISQSQVLELKVSHHA